MRHPNGDKIIVKRSADGHYVYFSVRDDRDNGSIIDFVQKRMRLSLNSILRMVCVEYGRYSTHPVWTQHPACSSASSACLNNSPSGTPLESASL